jgi:hypothetical protein
VALSAPDEVTVSIKVRRAGAHVRVDVSTTPPGINMEVLAAGGVPTSGRTPFHFRLDKPTEVVLLQTEGYLDEEVTLPSAVGPHTVVVKLTLAGHDGYLPLGN